MTRELGYTRDVLTRAPSPAFALVVACAMFSCRDREADREAMERGAMRVQRAGLELQLSAQVLVMKTFSHGPPPRDDREVRAAIQRQLDEQQAARKLPVARSPRAAASPGRPCPAPDPLVDCP